MLRFASIAVLLLASSLASAETKPAKQITELEHTALATSAAKPDAATAKPAELQRVIVDTLVPRVKASNPSDDRASARHVIELDRWLTRGKK